MDWHLQPSQYPGFAVPLGFPQPNLQHGGAREDRSQPEGSRGPNTEHTSDYQSDSRTAQESASFSPEQQSSRASWAGTGQPSQHDRPNQPANDGFGWAPQSQSGYQYQPDWEQYSGWWPSYAQYGYVNPAFLPQPAVATTGYSTGAATNAFADGYGGPYSGYGQPPHWGQQPASTASYSANPIPLAYGQAQPGVPPWSFWDFWNFCNSQTLEPQTQSNNFTAPGLQARYDHPTYQPPLANTSSGIYPMRKFNRSSICVFRN